jgi:aspartate aminotransferase
MTAEQFRRIVGADGNLSGPVHRAAQAGKPGVYFGPITEAAAVALNGDQACVAEMNKHFKARHDFFVAGLNRLPGFKVLPSAGTFYAWCDVSEAIRNLDIAGDHHFAEFLLDKAGVAGVPGSGFGAHGHIRFSFAVSMQTLEQALERIGKALRS